MSTSKTSRIWTGVAFAVCIITLALVAWVIMHRQYVVDQLAVWDYKPSAAIQSLDDKVQFTSKGLFTFYATKPVVVEASDFNSKCPRQEAGSPILGCYTGNDRIYVFDISNQQLDGMKEVTAAHEMLHAVWNRTSPSEQARIGTLLTTAYEKNASPELKSRMEYYQRNEPGAYVNELHSILGTEVSNLGPDLESYYAQYFKNRQTILDLHAKYSAVYTNLNTQASELYAKMQALASSIQTRSADYTTHVNSLSNDIDSFNKSAANNSFSSLSAFNTERASLVKRSVQLEAERVAINDDITTYGGMYSQYQTLSSQIEGLNNSVDSFKALGETPQV